MGKPVVFDRHPYNYNSSPPTYRFAVERVRDGDTYEGWVDFGLRNYDWREIRLRGIDTPEIYSPSTLAELEHGQEAAAFATSLLVGNAAIIKTHRDITTYSRFEAEVYVYIAGVWRSVAADLRTAGFEKRISYS